VPDCFNMGNHESSSGKSALRMIMSTPVLTSWHRKILKAIEPCCWPRVWARLRAREREKEREREREREREQYASASVRLTLSLSLCLPLCV
jgi:hypothetical protein